MRVTTFGTRGSIPVSGPRHARYGGNTTCVRIESAALAPSVVLAIDAGSGFFPLAQVALSESRNDWVIFHTHYHLDHISGITVSLPVYDESAHLTVVGPLDDEGVGPREAYVRLMNQPFHPVSVAEFDNRIKTIAIADPMKLNAVLQGERGLVVDPSFAIDSSVASLKVTAFLASHPSKTLGYRFDETHTGRSFVFMTDDEVRDPIPQDLISFLKGADLFITDAQYSEVEYQSGSKHGWGHGTPTYAIELARLSGIRRVALTHHDPLSSDDDVDRLLGEATTVASPLGIECTACADGSIFDLD